MATSGEIGAWEAQDTTVDEVERQLGRILHALHRAPAGENGQRDQVVDAHPVPRASVLNLVVRTDDMAEAEEIVALMETLASRHPSRTLILAVDPTAATDGLDAAISTRAVGRAGGGQLVFEQVGLVARGAAALHVATVAEPLLISNLPVFLWWPGRPPRSHDALLDLCDRLMVDSAAFPDAPAGLAALEAAVAASDGQIELGDLGWRRLAPWRQVIASCFDPLDARPYQHQIRQVDVEYAATPGDTVGAAPLLTIGWLAARLGWEPQAASSAGGTLALTFAPAATGAARGGVTVRLRPRTARGAEPGELIALRLLAGTAARFEVQWGDDRATATVRTLLPGTDETQRAARLERLSMVELLARELELPAADAYYAESLAVIARALR